MPKFVDSKNEPKYFNDLEIVGGDYTYCFN